MIELICYKKCGTCRKAEKTLTDKGIPYSYREIDKERPSAKEIKTWISENDQVITKWLNTSGMKYRELNLSKKRKDMTQDQLLDLMATDGMLVKRPIMVLSADLFGKSADESLNKKVLVGPQVQKYLDEILD